LLYFIRVDGRCEKVENRLHLSGLNYQTL